MTGEDAAELPKTGLWLMEKALWKQVENLPLNKRRHLSSIGYIATKAYGMDPENKWQELMYDDIEKYQQQRNTNGLSDYEKKNLPKSMKDMLKAAREYHHRIKRTYTKENPTLHDLYKVQKWFVLRLVTELPFRNDLPTVNVKAKTGNYLDKVGKTGLKIVMQRFKNSDKIGTRTVKLSRGAASAVKKFLKYRAKSGVTHDFLLSSWKGEPMTKKGYSQMLLNTTEELLDKRVGSRMIRVLFATENKQTIEQSAKVTNDLLHTAPQTRQYVRKT